MNISAANSNGAYYQSQWSGYNGQYFATTYSQKRSYTGGSIYTSFVVVEPYLNFKIISAPNQNLYVEILKNNNAVLVVHYGTPNATGGGYGSMSNFASASINMTSLMCQTVQVKVVSDVYGATASQQNQFIAVGDFQQSGSSSQTSGIVSSSETLNAST